MSSIVLPAGDLCDLRQPIVTPGGAGSVFLWFDDEDGTPIMSVRLDSEHARPLLAKLQEALG